jgi:hypothetical protein
LVICLFCLLIYIYLFLIWSHIKIRLSNFWVFFLLVFFISLLVGLVTNILNYVRDLLLIHLEYLFIHQV